MTSLHRLLYEAIPYIQHHRGTLMLVALPMNASAAEKADIYQQMGFLHLLGIRILLQLTDDAPIDTIANADIAEKILTYQHHAHHALATLQQSAKDTASIHGNFVVAHTYGTVHGVAEHGKGHIRTIKRDALTAALKTYITILTPIAYSNQGAALWLDSQALTERLVAALTPDKTILMQAPAHMPDGAPKQLHFKSPYFETTDNAALNLAKRLAEMGTKRSHVLNLATHGVMLDELFLRHGAGHLVNADIYEAFRPARPGDATALMELFAPFVEKGVLIPRDEATILADIAHYFVMEHDQFPIGGVCLETLTPNHALLSALCIRPENQKQGLGSQMLSYLTDQLRRQGIDYVVAFSTQSVEWFLEHGFEAVPLSDVPEAFAAHFDVARCTTVLRLTLSKP